MNRSSWKFITPRFYRVWAQCSWYVVLGFVPQGLHSTKHMWNSNTFSFTKQTQLCQKLPAQSCSLFSVCYNKNNELGDSLLSCTKAKKKCSWRSFQWRLFSPHARELIFEMSNAETPDCPADGHKKPATAEFSRQKPKISQTHESSCKWVLRGILLHAQR